MLDEADKYKQRVFLSNRVGFCLRFSAVAGPLPDVPPIPKAAGTLLFNSDKEVTSSSARKYIRRSDVVLFVALIETRARLNHLNSKGNYSK